MIDANFVDAIRKGELKPIVETVDGRHYLMVPDKTGDGVKWDREELDQPESLPETLTVRTLSAFAQYVKANTDKLTAADLLAHVVSPTEVRLYSNLTGAFAQRALYLTAALPASFGSFKFGEYLGKEAFGIGLQTFFQQSGQRDLLWAFCASMKEGAVREYVDDGVSQEVTAKAGITMVSNAPVPNPVTLQPYRTFRDIKDQVASQFILRAKGGSETAPPSLALFEADGGSWQLEAIQKVAAFLAEKLDGVAILA